MVLLAFLQLIAEACRSIHEIRLASLFSGGQTGGLLSNLLFLVLVAAGTVMMRPSLWTALALNLVAMAVSLPVAIFGLLHGVCARLQTTTHCEPERAISVGTLLVYALPMLMIQLFTFGSTQADLWIAGICWPHDELAALWGRATVGAADRHALADGQPDRAVVDRRAVLPRPAGRAGARVAVGDLHGRVAFHCGDPAADSVWRTDSGIVLWPFLPSSSHATGHSGHRTTLSSVRGGCNCALEMTGNHHSSLVINLLSAVVLATIGTWAAQLRHQRSGGRLGRRRRGAKHCPRVVGEKTGRRVDPRKRENALYNERVKQIKASAVPVGVCFDRLLSEAACGSRERLR